MCCNTSKDNCCGEPQKIIKDDSDCCCSDSEKSDIKKEEHDHKKGKCCEQ